jgi:hypothetical protein
MHPGRKRASRRLGSIVGLLVLAGATCGSGSVARANTAIYGVVSGSRLRARFYDGGEGAILFGGWFDSELGVDCTFVRTRDGATRCLPSGQPAVWMDATCTMPVWRAEVPGSLPPYVTAWLPQGAAAYALGEPYTGAVHDTGNATWGWERSCLGIDTGGGSYFSMRAEISPERLVAATISSVPIDDGKLFVRTLQGDDGSSQVAVEVNGRLVRGPQLSSFPPATFSFLGSGRLRAPSYVDAQGQLLVESLDGFIDTQADVPCQPVRFGDGLRCVPWRLAHVTRSGPYLDAGCTTLLSESRRAWGPTTTAGATAVARTDGPVATAYTLGEAVTPDVVYFKSSTCEPRTAVAGAVYRPATPAGDGQWASVVKRVE